MPKFHFPIVNGQRLEDPVGIELADNEAAKVLAPNIARHVRSTDSGKQRNVLVENETGTRSARRRSRRTSTAVASGDPATWRLHWQSAGLPPASGDCRHIGKRVRADLHRPESIAWRCELTKVVNHALRDAGGPLITLPEA